MADSDSYGKVGARPSSKAMLARAGVGVASNLALVLHPLLWEDTCFFIDDFLGDTLNLDFWTLGTDATATAFAIPATPTRNGILTGATGTTAAGYLSIMGAPNWSGDGLGGCEIRFALDVVTGFIVEGGLINTATDATVQVVTDVDVPTVGNGGTDVAVVHLNTAQTLTTAAFVTEGSTTSMNPYATGLSAYTPPAATYVTMRVQLSGDTAGGAIYEGRSLKGAASHGDVIATQIEGGTNVRPWFILGTANTTAKIPLLDLVAAWGDR